MTPRKDRVNEIDLLRFLAAVSVLFYHFAFRGYAADGMSNMPYPALAPVAQYGYLGVELFFIISGFVILMTAENASLKSFVISRCVRLYPAFWACCTLTFLTILAIGAPRYEASFAQYAINMSMASAFVGVDAIDGSYWSLFVEMKFYLLVAVVILLGRVRQSQALLVFWLCASVVVKVGDIGRLRSLLIVDYSAFFIAGAAYFLVWSQGITLTRIGVIAGSWVLAVWQSIGRLSELEKHFGTDMSGYVVAAALTTFFVVMFLVATRRTGRLREIDWKIAGAITYPLYLLHQTIGFAVFNSAYPAVNPHVLLWTTTAAMVALAYTIHVAVERKSAMWLRRILVGALEIPLPRAQYRTQPIA
jgi:peptidoglycan/LPS O-acetylase OafA/YrhL